MPVLTTEQRNKLESTVKQARRIAETAAKVALERLHVGSDQPGSHLTPDERVLRNKLRAHGRQLGDQRDAKGTQALSRLVHECAYEHWHRMLFARFLAENNLLMHPDGVPVTLAECEDIAKEEGAPNGWTLAARYAAFMLPQIFRPDDPVLQVSLAPEHQKAMEKLLMDLTREVFTADDSLGWVYQFWQAEKKAQVNASGDKITGETLPAVTQLFTEHYMVLFLLHNTIGIWWAARLVSSGRVPKDQWARCQTEEDCRKLAGFPGYEFTYLRFIKDDQSEWVPAAGKFPQWPKSLQDFKLLDPCCGSGHFLVAAFELLVQMWMADQELTAQEACDAVLRENLHGLELDARCTQIAAFALALTAWKFTDGFRPLPPLNIACSGVVVNARKQDWLALANGDTRLGSSLEQLYGFFQQAPELGSLINPRLMGDGDLVMSSFAEIQPLLNKALQAENAKRNEDINEIGVAAQGMALSANLLTRHYTLVVTNVPYLKRGKQAQTLQEFSRNYSDAAKPDLATVFVEKCLDLCAVGGTTSVVTPEGWLFLSSYTGLRNKLLTEVSWEWLVLLGARAFQTPMYEFNVILLSLTKTQPSPEHCFWGVDVTGEGASAEKAKAVCSAKVLSISQREQMTNPDQRVVLGQVARGTLLSNYAEGLHGQGSFDDPCFVRSFWEMPYLMPGWVFQQTTGSCDDPYSGCSNVFWWEDGTGRLFRYMQAKAELGYSSGKWRAGIKAWGKKGVAISGMGELYFNLYTGGSFDTNVSVVLPKDEKFLPAIWHFCRSPEFSQELRKIDRKLKVTCNTLVKVPIDLRRWQKVAQEAGPLPEPSSNDPTQWLFAGHPMDFTGSLQVAVARLLSYRWPRQTGQRVSGAAPLTADGLEEFEDQDGIVCVPSVRGESPAAERLRTLLSHAYSKKWSPAKLDELLSMVDYAGSNLEDWLRNGFFEQHCKLFHNRTFIWQIWDGRKDGFSALVNYHKLDHKNLEKLTFTYLGDWINRQEDAVKNGVAGADDRLLKARQLQDKLKLILEGEAPYDIFVRWKSLEQQPIGWNPDLNDGVRLNIRPFVQADILRKRPNIKWGVDRGKNPPGSPWGEIRDNDRHLTLAEKQSARKQTM